MADPGEAGSLIAAGVTRVEEHDLVRALRLHPLNRRLTATAAGVAAIVSMFVAHAIWRGASFPSWIGAALLAVGAAFVSHRTFTAGRSQYRRWDEWQRQQRYEIAERRFRIRTEKSTTELDWEFCDRYWELPDIFVLSFRQAPNAVATVFVMPKRAFESAGEIDRVRAALNERVRPKKRGSRILTWTLIFWMVLIVMFVAIYQLVTPH